MSGHAAQSHGGSAPAAGELIARKYRVERLVGRGGMGVVLAARHLQLGQTVAIKLLTPPTDEDRRDEAIARFLNEAQAAARLQNDHVVRIYDVGQLDSGLPFMVMELLSGQDLGTLLDERGPLPEPEAVDYVLQACAGVAEAHHLGIVHRDLKPSNLFVTRRSDGLPWLKVLDFGISKQLSDPSSGQSVPTFTNTRTVMGSPNYMSPEQVRDARRVDARTDIWAMGIVLQELITNAPVFQGESFPGVCAAIVADPPLPVRTLRPDVSPELEHIIERCLQKDVEKRYQTIGELAAALSPLGSRSLSGSTLQPITYSSHPRLRAESAATSPAALDGPTVAMPSGPEPTPTPVRSGTLESARLLPNVTKSAPTAPDSPVEIVEPRPATAFAGWSRGWLALMLAATALLGLGAIWLKHVSAPAPLDAEGQSESSPLPAAASFRFSVESEPPGASVSEGSARLGATPFSLELTLPQGAPPRVFVLEKEGFEPYVVRQGPARADVAITAPLQRLPTQALPSSAPSATSTTVMPASPRKPPRPVPAKPALTTPRSPSDIRLER